MTSSTAIHSEAATLPTAAQLPPIVCLGIPRWEGSEYLSSTVQLMGELSRHERVLYVDYPYTYKDVWAAKRGQATGVPLGALIGTEAQLQVRQLSHGGEVQLLRLPPFLPANFASSSWLYDQLMHWNARRAKAAILEALAALGWVQPIVINAFNPALGNMLAGELGESKLIYYCYDEISAAPWMARHGGRHEQIFLNRVDLTIVSSDGLYKNKSTQTKRCVVIKNGVDLSVFKAQGLRPNDLPKQPIIGYIGSVDDRLDYDLLTAIAQAYPEHALVFVGRIMNKQAAEQLHKLPNVHLLGPRPIDTLGSYLAAFDLGLIPFVKNDLTAGIYPLKINEYLALGLPVVSTDFADLSDFEDFTQIAANTATFVRQVGEQLSQEKEPESIRQRQAFAAQNTWEGRALAIRELLKNNTKIN